MTCIQIKGGLGTKQTSSSINCIAAVGKRLRGSQSGLVTGSEGAGGGRGQYEDHRSSGRSRLVWSLDDAALTDPTPQLRRTQQAGTGRTCPARLHILLHMSGRHGEILRSLVEVL